MHVYDPLTDLWAVGPDMSEPRRLFASFLGSDDRVYVIGGDNLTGGSFGVESIYTTPCPEFVVQPNNADLWLYANVSLTAQTIGGGTITYQWTHDGSPIVDGTSVGGGMISGALTPDLMIEASGELDSGEYALVATNACGDVSSTPAAITVQSPPDVPENWTWTNLHPSFALSSSAHGVDNGVQVGTAVYDTPEYNGIDHPMKWEGSAASGINLTQAGSQGGSITDIEGDRLVGWWWKPIQCYVNHQWQTCYYRRGAWWNLDGTFHETNYSGFEYTSMNATDGTMVVGSGTTDDASGNVYTRAVIWQGVDHQNATALHPSGYRSSYANAADGDYQYGAATLAFQGVHAAMWSGSQSSFIDMHPAGAINSTIYSAADGQQVGIINQWNDPHAGVWSNSPGSFVDLHPDGATDSNVNDCAGGLQIGSVGYPDGLTFHPGIWSGHKDTFYDLMDVMPAGFAGLALNAIDIEANGTVSIAGSAWNIDLQRREAVLISSTTTAVCPADLTGDGVVNFFDVSVFLSVFASSDPIADFTGDGNYNFFDVSAFLTAFGEGCP